MPTYSVCIPWRPAPGREKALDFVARHYVKQGNPHEAHLWYPTHEWAMDFLKPDAHTRGDIVGTYWSAP